MKVLKKLLLTLCLVLAVLAVLPGRAEAAIVASGECGANLTWTLDDEGTLTISGEGAMYNYDWDWSDYAPWDSTGYSIKKVVIDDGLTTIGEEAFRYCPLQSVTIPDSVTTIGSDAFKGSSLQSVTIPDSVTTIGSEAFAWCRSITSVTMGNSVTTIGYDAFYSCDSLQSVYITDLAAWCAIDFNGEYSNPLVDAENLYLNGTLVTDLVIPGSVTTIGSYAFEYCNSLTSVTIPDSVTTIGGSAFSYCDSLTSVYITDLAAWCDIGFYDSYSNPLYYAENLYLNGTLVKDLVIPDGVKKIKKYAFYVCDSLTSVTIGDSVTTIGAEAFYVCDNLMSVTIPDSVTTIGEGAFYSCDSLTSVTIPDSVTTIGAYAFCDCYRLTSVTIGDRVTTIGEYAFSNCDSLERVTIPDSVTTIGAYAFCVCYSLTSVTMGKSVTTIGDYAFSYCDSLQSVHITDLAAWCAIDFSDSYSNPLYYANKLYLNGTLVRNLVIPEGITEIKKYAFYYCPRLQSVTIPDSVTAIGDYAFYFCTSLRRVTIPDSVTTIGDYAFYWCSSLTDVYYAGTESQWNQIEIGFDNDALQNATIHFEHRGAQDLKLPVLSTEEEEVMDIALAKYDYSKLLPDITTGFDTLRGPSITVGGETFHLFEMDGDVKLELGKKVTVQAKVDTEKKTISILLGYKFIDGSTTIVGDPESLESAENDFWKSYLDAKDLHKLVTGASANSPVFRNRFQNSYDNLKKFEMDLIVKASARFGGYIELSYETGQMKLSEGGGVLGVELSRVMNGRIPQFPLAYVTLRFEADADGKLRIMADDKAPAGVNMGLGLDAKIAVDVGAGLGDNTGDWQAYVEGGVSGKLGVALRSGNLIDTDDQPPLSIDLTGGIYFEYRAKAWVFEAGNRVKYDVFKLGLFPKLELLSEMEPQYLTMEDYIAEAKLTTREYLYAVDLLGVTDDYSFSRTDYPYAEPTLLHLGNGEMLMVWVSDNGTKADEDRTSIYYSTYEDGVWSAPAAIHESGTYADHPVLVQDGDTVHAIWMQASKSLVGVEMADAFKHLDLVYASYNGSTWTAPVTVSAAGNNLAETNYAIDAKDGSVAVVWLENGDNDLVMASGTNTAYLRTMEGGAWSEISQVYTAQLPFAGLDVDLSDGQKITYSVQHADDSIATYVLQNGAATEVENAERGAVWIGGDLYELRGDALYCNETATGLSGLTNFEIISSGSQTVALTLVPTGFTCELFASYYDAGSATWGNWIQLTGEGKYIRSYSAVLDDSNRIVAALNLVDVVEDADRIYDNTDAKLVVVDDCKFSDLVVSDWITYDDSSYTPGGTLPLSFEVTNNSAETLTKVTATVGSQTETISCSVASGESAVLTVDYTLPATLSTHEITITAVPAYSTEEATTENNSVSAVLCPADLTAAAGEPVVSGTSASVSVSVKNSGYEKAEDVVLTIYNGNKNGKVLHTAELGDLAIGGETSYTYSLPAELLFLNDAATLHALNFEVTSQTAEHHYENNGDRIVFGNLMPMQVEPSVTGETVKFKVTVTNGTGRDRDSCIVLALYAENGRMLTVRETDLTAVAGTPTSATLTVQKTQFDQAAYAKALWLDASTSAPVAKEWSRTLTEE